MQNKRLLEHFQKGDYWVDVYEELSELNKMVERKHMTREEVPVKNLLGYLRSNLVIITNKQINVVTDDKRKLRKETIGWWDRSLLNRHMNILSNAVEPYTPSVLVVSYITTRVEDDE